MMMQCYIRILVDGTALTANTVVEHVVSKVAPLAFEVEVRLARPYYKVDGWQEVGISFAFDGEAVTFDNLLALLSESWKRSGARTAVWNADVLLGGHPDAPFVDPSVTWACMEWDD